MAVLKSDNLGCWRLARCVQELVWQLMCVGSQHLKIVDLNFIPSCHHLGVHLVRWTAPHLD